MPKHEENGRAVAEFLRGHSKVRKVYWPGFTDHPGHQQRQIANGDVFANADVQRLLLVIVLDREAACRRQVVHMQELAARTPRAPQHHLPAPAYLRLVKLPDQRRHPAL